MMARRPNKRAGAVAAATGSRVVGLRKATAPLSPTAPAEANAAPAGSLALAMFDELQAKVERQQLSDRIIGTIGWVIAAILAAMMLWGRL